MDPMKRWRLIIMPVVVVAVGVWASTNKKEPLEVKPGKGLASDPSASSISIDQPKVETAEHILETDPLRFLEMSLEKYDRTIQGYTHILEKHERIQGKLSRPEKVKVCFHEKP